MPYNPQTDATQVIRKPYKRALKWLAETQRNRQQNIAEKLIDQAIRAHGKRIEDFENKNEPKR